MIYRAHVVVLCAAAENWLEIPESERTSHDAVAYVFGINAHDPSDAVNMAVTAAKDAFDREGDYIGGVVIEADCRCALPNEFSGFEKHFHSPMSERGIFYVSGVTYTWVPKDQSAEAAAELAAAKERISRNGLPAPSFVHPKSPEEPPTRVRMLCSACGHWVEVSNAGLIYSFMSGLDMFSREGEEAKQALNEAGPFVSRHLSECSATIEGIQEDDPRWSTLEENKREGYHAK